MTTYTRPLIQAALAEVRHTHRYASAQVVRSLAAAQALMRDAAAAHCLTPAQEAAVRGLTDDYLRFILTIAEEAGAALMAGLAHGNLLPPIGVAYRDRIDETAARYRHTVHAILRR